MLPIGDIIDPLNLSDEDKKELVDKMRVAMETTALKLMADMITNGQGFEKLTSFPKRKVFLGGNIFNMFTA